MKKTGRALGHYFLLLAWAVLPSTCLISVPAFVSCSGLKGTDDEVMTEIRLMQDVTRSGGSDGWWLIEEVDVFTFSDSGIRSLECYEHIAMGGNSPRIMVRSTSGEKRCVALANCHLTEQDIERILRYEDLETMSVSYRQEDPMHPSMSGETTFRAGSTTVPEIRLRPFMSEIEISTLAPGGLEDIYVYMVNAAGSCPVLQDSSFHPTAYLNYSCLREKDLSEMRDETILCHGLEHPEYGTTLYCYPNTVEEESIGSPFTRLVIEGKVDGGTRIYPIEIGRPGEGVGRGKRYSYSISIGDNAAASLTVHPGNFIMGRTGDYIRIWCDVRPEGTPIDISEDDLEFDHERGIYDYVLDGDGKGVTLHLTGSGTGMFCIDAAEPVCEGVLVVVVVDQDHIGI